MEPLSANAHALARTLARAAAEARDLPGAAGLVLVLVGLFALVAGARWRRPIAVAGAALAGALAASAFRAALVDTLGLRPGLAVAGSAAALGLAALALPIVFPLALGGALGAALGARLPLGAPWIGAALGALALGGLVTWLVRPVAAAVAGVVGAALVVGGILALAPAVPGSALLVRHPILALGALVVLAVAGAAGQLDAAWGGGEGAPLRAGRLATASPRERD
jgi:hypothetical protein